MRPKQRRGRAMLLRGEAWLACVTISLCSAAFDRLNGADLTPGQLEALYQRIDSKQKMTRAEKYDAKLSILKSSLEAGGAYTDAMESLQRYARIGAEPASTLRPEVGKVLSDLSERVKSASDNPLFDAFGKISKGEGYVSQAVSLVSDIDKIQKNSNLPPSAQRELQVLRGAAEAVLLADELGVPVPNGLDCYAQSVKNLADAVLQGAESINTHKDGGLWLTEEKEMLGGLPTANYRRTPLFVKGIPVVEEVIREDGRERCYLQIEPGRWTEITKRFDYDQVANIVADYRCLYDGQNPTSREIVKYLMNADERKKLSEESFSHADYLITKDLQKDIAPDMPYPDFVDAASRLKEIADGLGLAIPSDSAMFRTILKEQIANPDAYDTELRRIALRRWPDARDYLEFKGVLTTDALPLDALAGLFEDYRRGGDQKEFVGWIAAGKPPQSPRTEESGDGQNQSGSHANGFSGTKKTSPPPSRTTNASPPPRRIATTPSPKKSPPPQQLTKTTPLKRAYPPSVKKPSVGGSTEKSHEFKPGGVTYNNKPLRFYYRPKKK
jgi:hypothetical protein